MNPAMLELLSGFRDRMEMFGQPFLLRRTQETFQGMMFSAPVIAPQLELGSDTRELSTLEVRRGFAPVLQINDVLEQTQPFWRSAAIRDSFPNPVWKVVRREDNPADFAIRYWVVKVVENLDPSFSG